MPSPSSSLLSSSFVSVLALLLSVRIFVGFLCDRFLLTPDPAGIEVKAITLSPLPMFAGFRARDRVVTPMVHNNRRYTGVLRYDRIGRIKKTATNHQSFPPGTTIKAKQVALTAAAARTGKMLASDKHETQDLTEEEKRCVVVFSRAKW